MSVNLTLLRISFQQTGCAWCTEICLYDNPADRTAVWWAVWLARSGRFRCWLSQLHAVAAAARVG